jgi:hypothetical protein
MTLGQRPVGYPYWRLGGRKITAATERNSTRLHSRLLTLPLPAEKGTPQGRSVFQTPLLCDARPENAGGPLWRRVSNRLGRGCCVQDQSESGLMVPGKLAVFNGNSSARRTKLGIIITAPRFALYNC